MKNLVIAKYLNGTMIKGYTLDIGNKDTFHLVTLQNTQITVNIDALKAAFLVKTMTGGTNSPSKSLDLRTGTQLHVEFLDSEEIDGVSFDYHIKKPHFFIFPLDESDNNERILINRAACRSVSKVPNEVDARQQKQRLQRQLEMEIYRCLYSLAEEFNDPLTPIDESLIVTRCLFTRKKMMPILTKYEENFGHDTWVEFAWKKIHEIRYDLGDQIVEPLTKIVNRLSA